MKARIEYFSQPKKKNAGYEAENIYKIVELPFVPARGMFLKVDEDGDFVEIGDVHLDISGSEPLISVGLVEPDNLPAWSEMKKAGWQTD